MPKAHSTEVSRAKHIPVLLHESIDNLDLKESETFVDATYGGGGHTKEILRRFPKIKAIGIDQDPSVVDKSGSLEVHKGNFRDIDEILGDTQPDAILFDLGISSDQLDKSGRGFSFQNNEPLDMRLSDEGLTAADILNSWDEQAIELILRGFGEERYSKKIAREIVTRRSIKPFRTTFDLVEAVEAVKPKSFRDKIHPATKTFQALRIAVNEELTVLEEGLEKAFDKLKPGGRLAVISFHSLEDRIVKNFFRTTARQDLAVIVTKRPIRPTEEEVRENPRSRSAKLRVIKKL